MSFVHNFEKTAGGLRDLKSELGKVKIKEPEKKVETAIVPTRTMSYSPYTEKVKQKIEDRTGIKMKDSPIKHTPKHAPIKKNVARTDNPIGKKTAPKVVQRSYKVPMKSKIVGKKALIGTGLLLGGGALLHHFNKDKS